ncbi:hypothetical protein ZWY2020_044053 [Hordeum vulgare]|nr:hypothetical protein ZWY2020_044053 [Hordeum vulgare]
MDVEKKGGRNYLTSTDEMDEAMLNCNVDIIKENVISRCKTIDRHYVNVNKMLSTIAFGWVWIHNKLMVDSEDMGSNYVKCDKMGLLPWWVLHTMVATILDGCVTICLHVLHANKDVGCYRHKFIKFWELISLVFSKDHATRIGARFAAESAPKITLENVNNINIDEEQKSKRYRLDESIAYMLGEKLDNFTSAYKADITQDASPAKPSSLEEIVDALNAIAEVDDDALLEAYDILIADDRNFKALMVLPERMKKKWILKKINQ